MIYVRFELTTVMILRVKPQINPHIFNKMVWILNSLLNE